jgi:toxin-antitoxin system PIN domain toxin
VKLIDLNVLLYVINEDAVHHDATLEWWRRAVSGDETIGLAWVVVLGFLRLATSAHVFPKPLEPATAARVVDQWIALENTSIVTETPDHWKTLRLLIEKAGTAGNLIMDAHLAALAMTHGAIIVSCDHDFARFKGLRLENPLD